MYMSHVVSWPVPYPLHLQIESYYFLKGISESNEFTSAQRTRRTNPMDTTKHSTPPARHLTARELEGGVQLPRELLRADLQLAWHAAKQDVQQNSGLHFTNHWPKRLEELESLERTAASDDQAAAAAFNRRAGGLRSL